MALTLDLREFGRAFATRGRGREVREEMLSRLEDGTAVTINFDGVQNVSYSFADELLGVLVTESHDDALTMEFVNMDPAVARVVRDAVSRRRGEPVAC